MAKRTRNQRIKAFRAELDALSPDDRHEVVWWVIYMTDRTRADRWMESLQRLCSTLAAAPTEDAAALFWIRVHGAMVELARNTEPWEYDPVTARPDPDGSNEERSAWVELTNREREADVFRLCHELRAEFTEDELLLIQWKRDAEAHAFLDGYEIKPRRGKVELHRDTALFDGVSIERVRKLALDHENERAELATAVEFARRAAPYVERIITALNSYEMF